MRLFLCLLVAFLAFARATLVNDEVQRTIDLRSHLVSVATKVTLKNTGDKSVSRFTFQVDPKHASELNYISFTQGSDNDVKLSAKKDGDSYTVLLPKTLSAGGEASYTAEEVYGNILTVFPEKITQSQNQLAVYEGNVFFYSPYKTSDQSTTVELPSATVESYTKTHNAEKSDTTIKYEGSDDLENVAPSSSAAMKIHFENNEPFLVVSQLERNIEVSHWGNIAVWEDIHVSHNGAKLKGSFSRYDYQRQQNSGLSSVKSFKTNLPASAVDVYYRDEIGNISTSNLLEQEESVELEIRPRFPLFGGWKTHYNVGYNVPSFNYLFNSGDNFALKMRVVDHIMDNQLVEDMTLKIILPEGCKNINVELPFEGLSREADSLHFTYLDTAGRPVITISGANLVDQHIEDIVVTYTFSKVLLLQEPLLVVSVLFLLFLTVIIAVRLDFTIAHDSVLEAKLKAQSVMENVRAQQSKRDACYKSYQAAISAYKASKDAGKLSAARKQVDKDHKEANNAIAAIVQDLKEGDAVENIGDSLMAKNVKKSEDVNVSLLYRDTLIAVNQLNKMDAELKDKLVQAQNLAEKLIADKLSRNSYQEQEKKLQIGTLVANIENFTDNL